MAYRRTEQVEARLADNRTRLLDAARSLMAERGFAAASMTAVAARAGLATGSVYRYFPSKSALLAEVFEKAAARELAVMRAVSSAPGRAAGRLEAAVETYARRAIKGRRIAWALIAEPADPTIEGARIALRRGYCDLLAKVLKDGIASGEFPEQDVGTASACVVGAMIEPLVGPLAPDSASLTDGGAGLVENVKQFCLRAVSGHLAARPHGRAAAGAPK